MTTIETERLVLRAIRDSDAEAITSQIGNYNVARNLSRVPYPYTKADAEWFLNWIKTLDQNSLFVAITERSGIDKLIGVMSYEFSQEKADAELGYWLAEPYWRNGYMKETARAVVNHAFSATPLDKMVSCYFNDNQNSGRILAGVGFETQGPCMAFSRSQNKDVPVTNMALTRERWLQTKKP